MMLSLLLPRGRALDDEVDRIIDAILRSRGFERILDRLTDKLATRLPQVLADCREEDG